MTALTADRAVDPGPIASDIAACGPRLVRAAVEHPANHCPDGLGRAALIDGIADLEAAKSALEAAQAEWTRAFARAEVAHQIDRGLIEPEKLERSIAAQVGMACRVSPAEGRKRVRVARDLHQGLDHLRALAHAGELSAYKVSTIVGETAHLDRAERAQVDRLLAAVGIDGRGIGKLRELARRLAAQVAPGKVRARCTAARSGRRITLRLSSDGMTDLTAHLPAEQGAACYAALRKAFNGPVPPDVLATTAGRTTWRRLLTRQGIVIGGDSKRRRFSGFLAELIRARDRWRCTESYCDAPIRETDHVVRAADGGPTTFDGGRGTCQFHNQLRELPGWTVERVPEGVLTTTPTGHASLYRIPTTD